MTTTRAGLKIKIKNTYVCQRSFSQRCARARQRGQAQLVPVLVSVLALAFAGGLRGCWHYLALAKQRRTNDGPANSKAPCHPHPVAHEQTRKRAASRAPGMVVVHGPGPDRDSQSSGAPLRSFADRRSPGARTVCYPEDASPVKTRKIRGGRGRRKGEDSSSAPYHTHSAI